MQSLEGNQSFDGQRLPVCIAHVIPNAVMLWHACRAVVGVNDPSRVWQRGTHGTKRPDSQARWIRCSAVLDRDQLPVAE